MRRSAIMVKLFYLIYFGSLLVSSINGQRQFPSNFQFGSASAAYQVEGAWDRDGKGPSIWDEFTHSNPDKIVGRANGDVACNSYDLYKEDVRLLKNAGFNFYRFSISWSRIMAKGDTASLNEAGLQYYDNLINELLANGIEPIVTMYHWDLPQYLQLLGGMLNPLIVDYFVDYADVLFARYGDRVKTWTTFNEPSIVCENGYGSPDRAPFVYSPGVGIYLCGHHVLIAHAKIYDLYQQKYKRDGHKVGIVTNCVYSWPLNPDNPADLEAAEKYMQFHCGWYAHPIFSEEGGYPPIMVDSIRANSIAEGRPWSRLPEMSDELKEFIRGKSDYFGLNYYSGNFVTSRTVSGGPSYQNDQALSTSKGADWPHSASPWLQSIPAGLRGILNWIHDRYDNPEIIITENGWSDTPGLLEDTGRVDYLKGHLNAVLDAIADGVNVTGHTTWSLLDNFEWNAGYTERFGIYYVDFDSPTRARRQKLSVSVLKQIIETRVIP